MKQIGLMASFLPTKSPPARGRGLKHRLCLRVRLPPSRPPRGGVD